MAASPDKWRAWCVLLLAVSSAVVVAARSSPSRSSGGSSHSSWGSSGSKGWGSSGGSSGFGSSWLGGSKPSQGAFRPATGYPASGATVTGYPAGGSGSFRPAPGSAMPTMPVKYGGTPSKPAMMGPTFASGGGQRRQSSIMPFAMGAFAGTAAYAILSTNPTAKCNGIRPECYKNLCTKAMLDCPNAQGQTLRLVNCPESKFTECWESSNRAFECYGHARPTASANMVGFCKVPGSGPDSMSPSQQPGSQGSSGKLGPGGVELVPVGGVSGARGRGAGAAVAVALAAVGVAVALI